MINWLPAERPNEEINRSFPLFDPESFQLDRQWVLRFIPIGFFGRFLCSVLRHRESEALTVKPMWATGVLLQQATLSGDTKAMALVEQVAIPGSANSCVRFTVRAPAKRGDGAVELLKRIKRWLVDIIRSYRLPVERELVVCRHCTSDRERMCDPYYFPYEDCSRSVARTLPYMSTLLMCDGRLMCVPKNASILPW